MFLRHVKSTLVAVALSCSAWASFAAPVLWLSTSSNQLATVDVATGASQVIGNTGVFLTDIAFSPTGDLYGISFSNLYSVNKSTGLATNIGSLGGVSGTANALVFGANGTLYMAGNSLYTVNTLTGAASNVGGIGFQSAGDLAFVGGELFMAADNNHLVKINTATGAGTDIGNIGVPSVFGLASADNVTLYGMAGQTVFTINTSNGAAGSGTVFNPALAGAAAGSAFLSEAGAQVPEPASLALVALALMGLAAARRRVAARGSQV